MVDNLVGLSVDYMLVNGIGSVCKWHPVTKFEHGNHRTSKRKFNHMTVYYAATRIYMYVRKKILAPLMLQPVPSLLRTSLWHCRYVRTGCLHASCSYVAKRPHRGQSYRVALLSINGVGALKGRATQCVGALAACDQSSQNSNN